MIQRVDNIGNVFAHVTADIPFFVQELGLLIDQVCREDSVDQALFIRLIKLVQPGSKESKGRSGKDAVCLALFQVGGNLDHALAGGDHVVYDCAP